MNKHNIIYVYLNLHGSDFLVGTLYADFISKNEVFSFEYSSSWLDKYPSFFIDKDLLPYKGRQYLPNNKKIYGFLSDSSTDRWGRTLLKREEVILAKRDNRPIHELSETDFLIGLQDISRSGAFRFKKDKLKEFVANDDISCPPMENIRKLEQYSLDIEENNKNSNTSLVNLISPGSSLGGSRPKANVYDVNKDVYIAKFPSLHDSIDVGAWEAVCYDLAKLCGIKTPDMKIRKFNDIGSTILTKRFDRCMTPLGIERIPFISMMSASGKVDGEEASYLDMTEVINTLCSHPKNELKELFKRLIFNIAISNTDDHLKNHGLLLINDEWVLSPVYDINPILGSQYLSLSLNGSEHDLSYELAISTSSYYDLTKEEATSTVSSIKDIIKHNLKSICKKYGITSQEQSLMSTCFKIY